MRVLAATFAYNEGEKIRRTLARHPVDRSYDLLVHDDGSTDGALNDVGANVLVLRNQTNQGIGAAMKRVFQYSLDNGYDVLVIQAGNDKDDPLEIPALLAPHPPGRRRLRPGLALSGRRRLRKHAGLPRRRHARHSSADRRRSPRASASPRARTASARFAPRLLRDPRIDWRQAWLDRYELEPYLLLKTIRLGYRHTEVPVTKIYPPHQLGYTKMRPVVDWWSIVRPLVYLGLGLRK